jgi:hypothetical protein
LGNIHNSKGDKRVAKKYYEIALTLNPKFKDAQKALEKL